ncbi:ABC transporter substrate-binding protein, partial [Escherichia sp. HC-CC]
MPSSWPPDEPPHFTRGYGLVFGMSERKAMAKALLKQAGYDASHPLRFELFYNKYDLHEKTAIALSSEWKKWLGAQVTLRTMEWKTYLDARRAGDFMLSRQSWDAT